MGIKGGDAVEADQYMEYLQDLIMTYLSKHFTDEEIQELAERPIKDKKGKVVSEGLPLIGPYGLRKQLGEIDYEFFARAYFPEACFYPPCQFHHEQYEEMRWIEQNGGGAKIAIAAPRESAKSTLWNTIYAINNALYAKKHYIVIVSDSYDQAVGDLAKIKEQIEDNELILQDFGGLKGKSTWKTDAILTKNDVLIIAKGSGQKIRGIKHKHYRPDLLILDDIEDDESVASPDQRKKLMNWFNKVVTKAGSTYTDIVVIGTILHYDSLLNNLLERPGYRRKKYQAVIKDSDSPLWDEWTEIYTDLTRSEHIDPVTGEAGNVKQAREFFQKHKEEMTAGVELIWPEAKDIYYYKCAYIDEGPAAYNSEFQNNPVDPTESWITFEDFHYYDGPNDAGLPPLPQCVTKGACDPSLGKNDRSDFSAICSLGRDSAGYIYVIESNGERRKPDKIIQDIIYRQQIYGYVEFYAEPVQFQELMADNLRKESAQAGVYVNVVTEPRPKGKKEDRIKQLQPLIKNGYIRFSRKQKVLIEQLVYLGSLKHDDEADALQQAAALFVGAPREFTHSMLPGLAGITTNW